MTKSRMFEGLRTWNPWFGCKYACYNKGCILGNTLVQTRLGIKKAWHVKTGDQLIAFDGLSLALTTVEHTYRRPIEQNKLLAIDLDNGETIICTGEHPFYVRKSWVQASDLEVGDQCWFVTSKETHRFKLSIDNPMNSIVSREKVRLSKLGPKNPNWVEREERLCPKCGNSFRVRRTSKQRFCSSHCANIYRMTYDNPMKKPENKRFGVDHPLWVDREERICPQCGKRFEVKETSSQVFCSLHCVGVYRMTAYENPMKNPEIKRRALYKARVVKPTGIEQRIIALSKENNLPIKYVGNFAFWIGDKQKRNPDFIVPVQQKVVEVYDPTFPLYDKTRDKSWRIETKQFYRNNGYDCLILAVTWNTPKDRILLSHLRQFISNGLRVTKIRCPSIYELIKSTESGKLYVYNFHCEPHNNYLVKRKKNQWIILHNCWAYRKMAHRLGRMLKCQQCYDFKPHFHAERLTRIPRALKIFVVAHGDLFAPWVPSGIIHMILEVCRQTPKEMWFFETKCPMRYLEFLKFFPENTMLSTTIETNRVYPVKIRGRTPSPNERLNRILKVQEKAEFPIHIANEPIMDFDLEIMIDWMKVLQPAKVSVGYDSLRNCLPEPPIGKTIRYITELTRFTDVERKDLRL